MHRMRMPRFTLLGRIMLFLSAFAAALLLQVGISNYQSANVVEPMEQRTANIQAISQFLNDVEGCMTDLENYRWDYGDAAALIVSLRQQKATSAAHLAQIQVQIGQVSEEQYLLANAAQTTYGSLMVMLDEIMEHLLEGRSDEAAQLYYNKAEPCGTYLRQYTQQLLECAILDNQDAYIQLTTLNDHLKQVQNVVVIACFLLGSIVIFSLFRLLRSISQMSRAAQAISRGEFDTPDVDETQQDEIGYMAKAFNEMKRSMKQQVSLLEEKNEMERALHKKETEAL